MPGECQARGRPGAAASAAQASKHRHPRRTGVLTRGGGGGPVPWLAVARGWARSEELLENDGPRAAVGSNFAYRPRPRSLFLLSVWSMAVSLFLFYEQCCTSSALRC